MKNKEGRDYIQLTNCVAQVLKNGNTQLLTISETIELTPEEMRRLFKLFQAKETQ